MAAPPRPESVALLDRLLAALEAGGRVTAAELDAQQERTDRASPAIGAAAAVAWSGRMDHSTRSKCATFGPASRSCAPPGRGT